MKLSESKIDPVKFEQGGWVGEKYGTPIPEMGDLCLKVRGANNKDWKALQSRLIKAIPRQKRVGGDIDQAEQDRITNILLRDTCLLDWSGLEGDDNEPLPFSKETADKLLNDPELQKFREAVIWAASIVAEKKNEEIKADAKN